MKKPNWFDFNQSLYRWSVYNKYYGKVDKTVGQSHGFNIKDDQILNRIFDDYRFSDFKKARELVKKYKDKYYIRYEKLM